MGQWGLETSAGDSVHDCLQEICVQTERFWQKDVQPVLDYTWSEEWVTPFDKLGVVMHLLTHELTVPIEILKEVLEYANKELHPDTLANWGDGRKEMVVIEMNDINFAIENGGKGRSRHTAGLLENMANMTDGERPVPDTPTEIKLPCFGIIVTLSSDKGGAAVTSDMKETCSYCKDPACDMDCPQFQEHCSDRDLEEQQRKQAERYEFLAHRAAVDALESIIMAHAGCGVDIASNDYVAGIETAWEALANADFTVEPLG